MPKLIGTLMPFNALIDNQHTDTFNLAHQFLDWLHNTSQNTWQILPINPRPYTVYPDSFEKSPYTSYGIGLDPELSLTNTETNLEAFMSREEEWIHTYALFRALTDHFKSDEWYTWPHDIRTYQKQSVQIWTNRLNESIQHYIDQQAQLHTNWENLKNHANQKNITLIGDLPFYLELKSPLVWQYQQLFELNERLKPQAVSGAPAGTNFPRQVWNHPLYRYTKLKGIKELWKIRLKHASHLYHYARIDHAIGMYHYAAMSTQNTTQDQIRSGPGDKLFEEIISLAKEYNLNLIAEDLTDFDSSKLRHTLAKHNIPGQRVWSMSFQNETINPYFFDIKNYPENSISYTSTHDTPTLLECIKKLPLEQKNQLHDPKSHNKNDDYQLAQDIRDQIITNPSQISIIPIQDWLLIEDRINIPGSISPWDLKIMTNNLKIQN